MSNLNKKKYAVCMWGELRSVNSTIDNFYTNLVEPLDADVFLVVQKTHDSNMDGKINLFEKHVIAKQMYDRPENLGEVFKNYTQLVEYDKHNYLINSNVQIYNNFHVINKYFGDIFESNYDYIILTRSDFLHLFPFPDILNYSNDLNTFWCYDGHEYGGVNLCLVCVPSIYIKQFLIGYYSYLNDEQKIEKLKNGELNIEKFTKMIFDDNGWKIGKIDNNAFITCDDANVKTTWGQVQFSDEHNVYYKYIEQLDNTNNALNKYNEGKKWKLIERSGNKHLVID